ncbi:MAG: hypothetical protein JHD35_24555 [Sphingopyxis sp.]|uniref:hypothetical protein n=1 Tax=Bosea sp. (in: a-proteobacteria) TaxID=1871050 RepID=UPI0011FAEA27|nr:hypothetical protein [Bosea sp. (in: a-proteobacteria)]MBJ7442171.1 hypothetical protein [Sphingopyxis sp.]TAJ34352.1 MAG: hypothetical protein EPO59_02050 [Bosea sp. (in: a-proteobacteria)]|tara:strand:+ start:3235 stop:5112 length:1878 start_codon:yes stop_codon:yes gene_type:complete
MIKLPTIKRIAAEQPDEHISEQADLQNELIETRSETNEVTALRSILDEAKQGKGEFPSERPEGVEPLKAEARVLDGRQEPKLLPDRAFAVLDAIRVLKDADYADRTIIEDYVFRSLKAGWPANADGLTDAVLRDPDGYAHFFYRLPLDLAGYPRLTSAMTGRLLSNPSYRDLPLARLLRFGDHDLRLLIHQATRSPRSDVSRLIPDFLKQSRGSGEWRRVQSACFFRDADDEEEDDLIQFLDGLPMRWRKRHPDFDLLASTPEVRAAWVADLVRLAGEGDNMRFALLEGILWHGSERVDELVMTAAAAICEASLEQESSVLNSLSVHPSSLVRLRAAALRRMGAEEPIEPDRPLPTGILDSGRRLAKLAERHRASPMTWLGDRRVELAIESAVEQAAATFTGSYEGHWREDEEPLTIKLLGDVRAALGVVEADIAAVAGRRPGGRHISFSLHDRMVSKHEEGQPGTDPTASFSTDVCVIMTARRDGKVLAHRATLIQVKKLKKGPDARWKNSFEIVRQQLTDLSKNTDAAFYMLMGPESAGRTIEMIPARLVAEHLPSRGKTVGLRREFVALASRSLARWLTYDVVGLWTGDPKVQVVRKAAGADGRRPYLLVELEVSISSDPVD